MKRVYCIHEDRVSAEVGLRFAIASLMKHCATAELVVFHPNPADAFQKWVSQFPRVQLEAKIPMGAAGWDCKPHSLLSLLDAGADEAIWIDSDMIIARDPSYLFNGSPSDEFIATEEPATHPHQGSTMRTAGWGLPIGRSFPITFNSCVLRATNDHRPLLIRWREMLNDPQYKNAQLMRMDDRPIQFLSDQDVLTALIGSAEFSSLPVRYLWIGRDIIHCGGALGYPVSRRIAGLFHRTPPFLHGISGKPWYVFSEEYSNIHSRWFTFYRRLLQETSPYVAAARSMRSEVDEPTPWLDYSSPVGRILRVLGCRHFALQGLPLAIAANGIELANGILRKAKSAKPQATTASPNS